MDPFVVIAIDEFNEMVEEKKDHQPTSTPLSPRRVPLPPPRSAPAHVARPPQPTNVAFAYPSPVLHFIYKNKRSVVCLFIIGFATFQRKQIGRFLMACI